MKHRPIALIILDGFGYRASKEANAIAHAKAPTWNALWQECPHTTLTGSGLAVGLPEGQMGNSEVGHLTMGAGRVVFQDLTRINLSLQKEGFQNNNVILKALDTAKKNHSKVHVLGLLSKGGVHSHQQHFQALLKLAHTQGVPEVIVHAFLDGRDTPPRSAAQSLEELSELCSTLGHMRIGSIAGRYFAMDRDKRWERTEKVYSMLTQGIAPFQASNALEGLTQAYQRGENDEFVQPTRIGAQSLIEAGDVVFFMNFRADRAKQLSYALTDPNFQGFQRKVNPKLGAFVTLTDYGKEIQANIIFPTIKLDNLLGQVLEHHHCRQLRIAETEKYAHITYFFNGGRDDPYQGEDRILVPSPKVATYDACPEMSALEVSEQLIQAMTQTPYDVIICNFANADMVGHSGNFQATVKAIEVLDLCLERILAALKKLGGEAIITADHGNAECMHDDHTDQPHTAHTVSPVPFVYVGRPAEIISGRQGSLADIAPTLLTLLDLPIPAEMTGNSLVKLKKD